MRVICLYCGKDAELIDSIEIYKVRSYGMAWLCRPCKAWVGTHKNSLEHAPLGRLANAELRYWKKRAHIAFDPLWKSDGLSRNGAYSLLAAEMGIAREQMHIGMFDVNECKAAGAACERMRGKLQAEDST